MTKTKVYNLFLAFILVPCSQSKSLNEGNTSAKYPDMLSNYSENTVGGETIRLRRSAAGTCQSADYHRRVWCKVHNEIHDFSNLEALSERNDSSRSLHFKVRRCVGKCLEANFDCEPNNNSVTIECVKIPLKDGSIRQLKIFHHTECGGDGVKCTNRTGPKRNFTLYKIE